jgi:hypothetical protein
MLYGSPGPVPMLWISNEIAHIDPAYLRRFALLLEVKTPSVEAVILLLREESILKGDGAAQRIGF